MTLLRNVVYETSFDVEGDVSCRKCRQQRQTLTDCALALAQRILKGEVSLYHLPPVWLVWNQMYENCQFLFLFEKQTSPNQSNRRSTVQWYFPPLVFPAWPHATDTTISMDKLRLSPVSCRPPRHIYLCRVTQGGQGKISRDCPGSFSLSMDCRVSLYLVLSR
jgi:hypothetical protein